MEYKVSIVYKSAKKLLICHSIHMSSNVMKTKRMIHSDSDISNDACTIYT